jgi:hypothetical protein
VSFFARTDLAQVKSGTQNDKFGIAEIEKIRLEIC